MHQKTDGITLKVHGDDVDVAQYKYIMHLQENCGCRRRQLSCAAKDWWQERMREKS